MDLARIDQDLTPEAITDENVTNFQQMIENSIAAIQCRDVQRIIAHVTLLTEKSMVFSLKRQTMIRKRSNLFVYEREF